MMLPVLSLEAGDLGWRVRRDLVGLVRRSGRAEGAGMGAALSTKAEGLSMSLEEALERLAKTDGSMFSESSVSINSALRFPAVGGRAEGGC